MRCTMLSFKDLILQLFLVFFCFLSPTLRWSSELQSGKVGASLPCSKGSLEMAVPALLALSSESPTDLELGI